MLFFYLCGRVLIIQILVPSIYDSTVCPLTDWLTHQFGLDEVTDHLVVEVLDGRPVDPLQNIFLLQRTTTRSAS